MARFQQTLRGLAMGGEAFVQDEAGFGFDRAGTCSGAHLADGVTSGTGTGRSADGI